MPEQVWTSYISEKKSTFGNIEKQKPKQRYVNINCALFVAVHLVERYTTILLDEQHILVSLYFQKPLHFLEQGVQQAYTYAS